MAVLESGRPPIIKRIPLAERDELEPFLLENPHVIEEGLRIVQNQLQTDTGPLDILAVDEDGAAVVIELKNELDDCQINQGLRYYDWVQSNIAHLARDYPSIKATKKPRLILVAPDFSEGLKHVVRYCTLNDRRHLLLEKYRISLLSDGRKNVSCTRIDIDPPSEPPPSIEEKAEYIALEAVRSVFNQSIGQLRKIDVMVKPLAGKELSGSYRGRVIVEISVCRDYFRCSVKTFDGSGTKDFEIRTDEDFRRVMVEHIQPTRERMREETPAAE